MWFSVVSLKTVVMSSLWCLMKLIKSNNVKLHYLIATDIHIVAGVAFAFMVKKIVNLETWRHAGRSALVRWMSNTGCNRSTMTSARAHEPTGRDSDIYHHRCDGWLMWWRRQKPHRNSTSSVAVRTCLKVIFTNGRITVAAVTLTMYRIRMGFCSYVTLVLDQT